MEKVKIIAIALLFVVLAASGAYAVNETEELKVIDASTQSAPASAPVSTPASAPASALVSTPASAPASALAQDQNAATQPKLIPAGVAQDSKYDDPIRYTLGPDDVIEIIVLRHPEFSGTYPINLEGKIQYKFVGDLDVTGLTKNELEEKLKSLIASYVVDPEVNVTILEYKSKVIYVLGEVGGPGKYYMRSDTIPVREAVVAAGLPTLAAAMRKCRLITPDKSGMAKTKKIDIYAILYGGNLRKNIDMHPGDVLYVPATIMAKVFRVISPVTSTVSTVAGAPSGVNEGRAAAQALTK